MQAAEGEPGHLRVSGAGNIMLCINTDFLGKTERSLSLFSTAIQDGLLIFKQAVSIQGLF